MVVGRCGDGDRRVQSDFIVKSFLAPKGAYEVQMLSLRASVCPSVRLIMLYSSSKGVPKSS